MKYYVYVKDAKGKWTNEIGQYHDFEFLEGAHEAMHDFLNSCPDEVTEIEYKIEDENGVIHCKRKLKRKTEV
jgi:hypothetical protein